MESVLTSDKEKLAFDSEYIWHPYASLHNTPARFLVKSANGTEIETAEGFKLIDAVSSWWCVAHGHNAPEICEAIRAQTEKFNHVMFAGFTHEPAIELAERLKKFLPGNLNRIFFADSGSIAVECAVKMAVQYQVVCGHPERCKMAALKGGYHGDTAGAMALSDPDGMHVLFQGIMPKHYFAEQPRSRFDGEFLEGDFSSMEELVAKHRHELAAVICEPVFQGGNAMWLYHPEYLRRLRKLCDENGILLIFDEIASGFYRTGPRFAQEHAGVLPDIMCIGKALTGGAITMAAAVAADHVAAAISNGRPSAFMHGPTYMANPLACAAGVASLKLFETRNYAAQVKRIEKRLHDNLFALQNLENVADVRVLGAIGAMELKGMPSSDDILRVVKETGVWLRPFCNYLYTMPPLITTDNELDRITEAMKLVAECEPLPLSDDEFHE